MVACFGGRSQCSRAVPFPTVFAPTPPVPLVLAAKSTVVDLFSKCGLGEATTRWRGTKIRGMRPHGSSGESDAPPLQRTDYSVQPKKKQ